MQIPVVGGLLGRLPAAAFMIAALLVGASVMQAGNVSPDVISIWLGAKVLLLIRTAIAIMPVTTALAGLVGVAYVMAHHHGTSWSSGSIGALVSCGLQILILFAWYIGGGAWVMAHLGAA